MTILSRKDMHRLLDQLESYREFGERIVHEDKRVAARDIPEAEWLYWHRLEQVMPKIIAYIRHIDP